MPQIVHFGVVHFDNRVSSLQARLVRYAAKVDLSMQMEIQTITYGPYPERCTQIQFPFDNTKAKIFALRAKEKYDFNSRHFGVIAVKTGQRADALVPARRFLRFVFIIKCYFEHHNKTEMGIFICV